MNKFKDIYKIRTDEITGCEKCPLFNDSSCNGDTMVTPRGNIVLAPCETWEPGVLIEDIIKAYK